MSISLPTLTNDPDEEVFARPFRAAIDVAALPEPGVRAAPSAPTDPNAPSAAVGEEGSRPAFVAAPPDVQAQQAHFADLSFLESARMDREMARELHQSARSQQSAMSITAALMNMSNRRFLALAAGILLLAIGLLALRFPVFLSDFDEWGFQINCGSGFVNSFTQAGVADSGGTHFVGQCHTAVAMRRAWAIPATAGGALLLGGLLVIPPRQRSRTPR
jgi:hypothetical protein